MARMAVIGAGMGAMAAAARLAAAGHRVAVFERAGTHGGAVRRRERDGFGFDTGPGLLYLPAVYRDLFVKTGREPLEACVELTQVDPVAHHVFAGGFASPSDGPVSVPLPGGSRAGTVAALDAAFGQGAGERWSELLARARRTWEATRRPLLEEPLPAGRHRLGRDPYPRPRRRAPLRRRRPTLAAVARDELRDPRLVALLESHALAYGLDPRDAPASATVLPYLEQTFGVWYVGGGLRSLADAVYERCLARGVEFHFGTEVAAVVRDGGRAAGVELADGTRVGADAVVCGAADGPGADGGRGRAVGLGRFTVLLALRGARPEDAPHRTVVHTAGGSDGRGADGAGGTGGPRAVTVLRPGDSALVPDGGHESAVLSVAVPGHRPAREYGPAARAVDWTAPGVAERFADEVLAAVDAAGLGLGERLLWREVRTPADTERETGAPGGVVPPPALAGARGAFLRAPNRTRLPGLYRVGGSAHPGGGLAHAGMSGAMAAGLIVEGDSWRGSR